MVKVNLIHYTGRGHKDPWYAARLLIYTKNTRLNLTPSGLEDFFNAHLWPEEKVKAELQYMAGTIPSSWEFVDAVFSIQNVTRACAQQMTRTRNASYAMQSQRVTDVRETSVLVPKVESKLEEMVAHHYRRALTAYKEMVDAGVPLEDARGILPLNVHCNLIAKYNLRSFVELIRARDSLRVQGEYVDIVHQMKDEVLKVWPWTECFFEAKASKAIRMIEEVASKLKQSGAASGNAAKLAKAADLLKKD